MNQENRYQPPKADVADVAGADADELVSRWRRLFGAIIDSLIAGAILFPVMFASGFWREAMSGKVSAGIQLQIALLGLVLYLVLHGYLLHKYGQTIGKRLLDMRIVSVDDNSILPLWKVFVVRLLPVNLAAQIPVVGPLMGLLDALFVFRGDKRCIHDLIAGTKVIKASASWQGLADINAAD